jgi:hypothetical protein
MVMTKSKRKVVLHMEIDRTDAERFVDAFRAGKFAHLGVSDIQFPDHPELNPQPSDEGHAARHRPNSKSDSPQR